MLGGIAFRRVAVRVVGPIEKEDEVTDRQFLAIEMQCSDSGVLHRAADGIVHWRVIVHRRVRLRGHR